MRSTTVKTPRSCVTFQQYTSATSVSLCFHSRKEKFGTCFKHAILQIFLNFPFKNASSVKLCTSGSACKQWQWTWYTHRCNMCPQTRKYWQHWSYTLRYSPCESNLTGPRHSGVTVLFPVLTASDWQLFRAANPCLCKRSKRFLLRRL
jgi:hypothetical protein